MKTIITLCVVVLGLASYFSWRSMRMPDHFGSFTDTPTVEVADLIERPQDFLKKTVTISGVVRDQCTTMGCFFFFLSEKGRLRVDLEQIAMNAPRRGGRVARVEGQIVPYDHSYQFLASAVEFQ
jgi:hypothetical protein